MRLSFMQSLWCYRAHHRQLAMNTMSGDELPVRRDSTSALMFTAFCGGSTEGCAGW